MERVKQNANGIAADSTQFLLELDRKYVMLIQLADAKARVLLGVSVLMISIIIPRLSQVGFELVLVFPMAFAFLIMFFSVTALAPRIIRSSGDKDNILFFGNIAPDSFSKYKKNMIDIYSSGESLRDAILLNCYETCQILNKKYRYLNRCFKTCLWACIISPAFFLLIYFYQNPMG